MKLWQAILIGCDRRAQTFGAFFRKQKDGTCRSCALGAAIEGATGATNRFRLFDLDSLFPVLNKTVDGDSVENHIIRLNDRAKWPREKIALEFVKPIEEALEDLT